MLELPLLMAPWRLLGLSLSMLPPGLLLHLAPMLLLLALPLCLLLQLPLALLPRLLPMGRLHTLVLPPGLLVSALPVQLLPLRCSLGLIKSLPLWWDRPVLLADNRKWADWSHCNASPPQSQYYGAHRANIANTQCTQCPEA